MWLQLNVMNNLFLLKCKMTKAMPWYPCVTVVICRGRVGVWWLAWLVSPGPGRVRGVGHTFGHFTFARKQTLQNHYLTVLGGDGVHRAATAAFMYFRALLRKSFMFSAVHRPLLTWTGNLLQACSSAIHIHNKDTKGAMYAGISSNLEH